MKTGRCRQLTTVMIAVLLLFLHGASAQGDDDVQGFLDGIKHYEAGEYEKAAAVFETVAKNGIRNGKLYYNIANAYLKDNRLGPAILWYERAYKLIPGDPDLRFNLDYARSLLKDEPGTFSSPVVQIIFFWKDLLRASAWQWLGIGAGAIFWCMLAVVWFFKKFALKPFVYGFLILAVLSSGTAVYRSNVAVIHPRAVILDKAVSVRSGFSAETTELFVLHEGTLVSVEKQNDGFLKIRYAEDKIGWVTESMAEII